MDKLREKFNEISFCIGLRDKWAWEIVNSLDEASDKEFSRSLSEIDCDEFENVFSKYSEIVNGKHLNSESEYEDAIKVFADVLKFGDMQLSLLVKIAGIHHVSAHIETGSNHSTFKKVADELNLSTIKLLLD